MGWKETCAVDERMRFVMMVAQQEEPFAEVCLQFGVGRPATSGGRAIKRRASRD
jgi:hypothetical protein